MEQNLPAVGAPVEPTVRPLVEKLRERKQAVAWRRGQDTDYPTKWEPDVLCQQAANEIARLTAALKQANEQAERFERGWYLRGDALEVAVRQNEHDMLMTGEELRACRAALKETL